MQLRVLAFMGIVMSNQGELSGCCAEPVQAGFGTVEGPLSASVFLLQGDARGAGRL